MAAHIQMHFTKSAFPATEARVCHREIPHRSWIHFNTTNLRLRVSAVDRNNSDGSGSSTSNTNHLNPNNKKKGGVGGASSTSSAASSAASAAASAAEVPSSNYVVPFDKSSCITRPLNEILRDLNKRIPDNIKKTPNHGYDSTFISWYHANRMLSFYAPGWCGEIRDVIFSDNGSVTVVYRVTIRGSDDEAFRESTGTISSADGSIVDPVAAAEEIAFCRACARFGLGLYLYHEE